ncbi:MAG TPA: hypothetical protein VJ377_09415 [Dehalococcoidales bacterium]|nr:MAG: hypothetical protein A2Z05_05915 [Chloroflexi bacterium RBG_16_60_22]HJX13725.1 hypothetical protein [Dehalococcoidales bacterium]
MSAGIAKNSRIELVFAYWGVGAEAGMNEVWIDEVVRRTGGRLSFKKVTRGTPTLPVKADVFNDCPAAGGKYHLLDLIQTPFIFTNSAVGSRVVAQLYAEFKELRDELGEVKIVGIGTGALMGLFASRSWGPISSLESFKGARTRSLGPIDKALEALGARPEHPHFLEIGDLLEKGKLDAAVFGLGLGEARGWAAQAPYCTLAGELSISMHPMRIYMTWEAWNGLPPDIQKVIDSLGPSGADGWYAAQNGIVFDKTIPTAREYIRKNGEFITLAPEELSRWVEALQPVREAAIEAVEKKGKPGREFFKRMLELIKKFNA